MIECKICKKECKNFNSLGKHLHHSHPNVSSEDYYLEHIGKANPTCICGCKKKFRGFSEGYREFCSVKCRSNNIEPTRYWSGKKQPEDMIARRVSNTDQVEKEAIKAKNNMEKYGVSNVSQLAEVKAMLSVSARGRKNPRKDGHQQKIIESKTRNGTSKHSEDSKQKIRDSINRVYSSDDPPITLSENNHKNHVTGYFNGMFYRSSYELRFMQYCDKNNIVFLSAENKEYRCPYEDVDGKKRWYYPDYYLPDYDVVIEIKPASMLKIENVQRKITAGHKRHNLIVVDETVLENLDSLFEGLAI